MRSSTSSTPTPDETSIPPERLLRAALLQAFFSIRSERLLMEQLDYNLLYRWFVRLGVDDAVWDHLVFSKNRDRLLEAGVAAKFLSAVLANPHVKPLLSDEHFSVDGTLIEAWASMKSFRARDGGDEPPSAGRNGAIDGRTTRHAGYVVSQRKRKLVEEAFGWAKTIAGCAKVKVRGLARVGFHFTLAMAAYNLIRLPKLIGETA